MKLSSSPQILITSGTAICGGSAIASVSSAIRANSSDISLSLAVVFLLNAVALWTFPVFGQWLSLSQLQFGVWSAIAIHDTSSVVAAAQHYGDEALNIAVTLKLTRALFVIPIVILVAMRYNAGSTSKNITIPWFILYFILAVAIRTFVPLPELALHTIQFSSKSILILTLFLIGCTLNWKQIKILGKSYLLFGFLLWIVISIISLTYIIYFVS